MSRAATTFYACTATNDLVHFTAGAPGTVTSVGTMSFGAGEQLVSIDFRPADLQLYALTINSTTARVYQVNKNTATTSLTCTVTAPVSGTNFGMDFHPVVDRLRIVSDSGLNYRVQADTGSTVVDASLNGGASAATAVAYTNNYSGTTTTLLYDIDAQTDQLFTQNPPNNGTLVSVGSLGVDATDVNGFDIAPPSDSRAFAVLTVGGVTGLYQIDLGTGAATLAGAVGTGTTVYNGLSADPATAPVTLTRFALE